MLDDAQRGEESPVAVTSPTGSSIDAEAPDGVRRSRVSVSLAELLLLSAAVLVGIVALVSLAAAHLHHHTLPLVLGVSAILVSAVVVLVLMLDRPVIRLDLPGLLPAVAGLALAAIMFFPGFEYGTGDRDPGAYVEHAVAIARTHSIDFTDDTIAAGLPSGQGLGVRWPGLWIESGQPTKIFPQFYHLWPALMATAKDAGGFTGLFDTGPLVGLIAVGLGVAVGRRLAGWPGAWAAALLLSTNMLEVWQAKYPSSEIFGQMLFMGAMLGVVLTVRTRWRSAAAAGGMLLALSYLERPDGIVLVLLAWVALCAVVAARKFDMRAGWFTAAIVILLPYGFLQAYDFAKTYTLVNSVPTLSTILATMLGLAAIAAMLAWLPWPMPRVLSWGSRPRTRAMLGTLFFVVCAGLMLLGALRSTLFGKDYAYGRGALYRTYDEISLIRLSWFFSTPGLLLMLLGFGYVAWWRWRFDRWVIALSTAGLLTLYCYHVRNSPYLMWATRRFVTSVVPGMVLLIGCGAALLYLLLRRFLPSAAGTGLVAAALVGLMIFNVSESWPLRKHNENGGAIEVEQRIAALAGDQRGVFIWQWGPCCTSPELLFGGPLLATTGQSSVLAPTDPAKAVATVAGYLHYFKSSRRPVFYIANGTGPAPVIAGVTSTKVLELAGELPHWAETYVSRPKTTTNYRYDFTVYRLAGA